MKPPCVALARSSYFYLFILIDRRKRLHRGSLPLLISKEEEIADPIKEKGGGFSNNRPSINQNSAKIYTKSMK
jgi:hypothetical protein